MEISPVKELCQLQMLAVRPCLPKIQLSKPFCRHPGGLAEGSSEPDHASSGLLAESTPWYHTGTSQLHQTNTVVNQEQTKLLLH